MSFKTKILYVCPVGERGGVETVQINIIKGLKETEFDPVVVVLQDGPFVEDLKESGATVYVLDAGRVRNFLKGFNTILRLVSIIKKEDIKIVHSHNAKAHIYGGIAAKLSGVPCIYHLHGIPLPSFSRDGFVSFVAGKIRANKMIAVSKYVLEGFTKIWGANSTAEVLYNGIECPEGTLNKIEARKVLGLPEDSFIVGYIGRLQRWKGVDVFIQAASEISRKIQKVEFLVIGDILFGLEGEYKEYLVKLREDYGLTDRIRFTGFKQRLHEYYCSIDIIVVPSVKGDPLPTVVLEAMAYGRPVVASRIGGIPEIVEDGINGFLFSPGDFNALAERVLDLLKSPDKIIQFGSKGRRKIEEIFTIKKMVDRLLRIYIDLSKATQ